MRTKRVYLRYVKKIPVIGFIRYFFKKRYMRIPHQIYYRFFWYHFRWALLILFADLYWMYLSITQHIGQIAIR